MTAGTFESPFPIEDGEALAEQERAFAALSDSVRELVDATVRTRLEPDAARDLVPRVEELTRTLLADAQEGPLGLETCSDGRLRDHGNPLVGARNPFAPPLSVDWDGQAASTSFTLGAAYEGPPGHVHGGIIAAVLDQVLGTVPACIGMPAMTATLDVVYRRPTPLGQLSARASLLERDGWRLRITGELHDEEGQVTATADGLFVVPRWAREFVGTPTGDAGDFAPPAG